MKSRNWYYEKFDEGTLKTRRAPTNDIDGSITGRIIMNFPEWLDENPEERKRLGWIRHIFYNPNEIEYDKQTQYYIKTIKKIDEYTVEDVYYVKDKTEEMMELEEMLDALGANVGGNVFMGDNFM